jgi:hypothetical protein
MSEQFFYVRLNFTPKSVSLAAPSGSPHEIVVEVPRGLPQPKTVASNRPRLYREGLRSGFCAHIVQIGFERYLAVENLVDRKAYARALKSKSISKKSLSLIACRMPKPPMTPDDINALSKAWNESKAATDAVLAKFREGASKDEIDDAIRKVYATRGKVQEFHDKFFEN